MASTNTTANYGLPQYIATDKPTYLGDFNGAMLSIDTAIKGVSDMATANQGNIAQAQSDIADHNSRLGTVEAETTVNTSDIATANQNIINLQSQANTQGQQIATVTQATNANTLVIGSGTLDTTAKTIIPAINELYAHMGYEYFNTVQGNAVLSLPAKFNELYIAVGDADFEYVRTFVVPYALLSNSNKNFYTGNYVNSSNNSSVNISVNRTSVQLLHYFEHGESFIDTAYMAVFYK